MECNRGKSVQRVVCYYPRGLEHDAGVVHAPLVKRRARLPTDQDRRLPPRYTVGVLPGTVDQYPSKGAGTSCTLHINTSTGALACLGSTIAETSEVSLTAIKLPVSWPGEEVLGHRLQYVA